MTTPPAEFLLAYAANTAGLEYGTAADGENDTNCCIQLEGTTLEWMEMLGELFDYDGRHGDFMVFDATAPFSPAEALDKLGLAAEQGMYLPGPGAVLPTTPGIIGCQGWRKLTPEGHVPTGGKEAALAYQSTWPNGHSFWIWISEGGTTPDWIFEATSRAGSWARPINVREQFDKFAAGVRWVRVST